MSTDVDRLRNSCHKIRYIWGVALTVVVSVYMLYQYLGPPTFVGLGFLILIVPVSAALVKALEKMEVRPGKDGVYAAITLAYFTKDIEIGLVEPPFDFNGCLVKLGLTSLVR